MTDLYIRKKRTRMKCMLKSPPQGVRRLFQSHKGSHLEKKEWHIKALFFVVPSLLFPFFWPLGPSLSWSFSPLFPSLEASVYFAVFFFFNKKEGTAFEIFSLGSERPNISLLSMWLLMFLCCLVIDMCVS